VTKWKDGWLSRECIWLRSGISCGVQEWWGPSTGICFGKEWVTIDHLPKQRYGWLRRATDGLAEGWLATTGYGWLSRKLGG
jgi:hypothetical protein